MAGEYLGLDLLVDPDIVSSDPIVTFQMALWFWMTTPTPFMPSCHNVMTQKWLPLPLDLTNRTTSNFQLKRIVMCNYTVQRSDWYPRS